jgi:RNA polymerase subunit RPABC4/transcription elongation factor Spt4
MTDDSKLRTCPHCSKVIIGSSSICPHCQQFVGKPTNWFRIITLIVIGWIIILLVLFGDSLIDAVDDVLLKLLM